MVRSVDLLHFHHHTKVLHHPLLRADLWECHHRSANVWYRAGLPWPLSRTGARQDETLIGLRFVERKINSDETRHNKAVLSA